MIEVCCSALGSNRSQGANLSEELLLRGVVVELGGETGQPGQLGSRGVGHDVLFQTFVILLFVKHEFGHDGVWVGCESAGRG